MNLDVGISIPEKLNNVFEEVITKSHPDYFLVSNLSKKVPEEWIKKFVTEHGIDFDNLLSISFSRKRTAKGIKIKLLYDYSPFCGTNFHEKIWFESIFNDVDFQKQIISLTKSNYEVVDDCGHYYDVYVTDADEFIVTKDIAGLKKGEEINGNVIKEVRRATNEVDKFIPTLIVIFVLTINNKYLKDKHDIEKVIPYMTLYKNSLEEGDIILDEKTKVYMFTTTAVISTILQSYVEFLKKKSLDINELIKQYFAEKESKINFSADKSDVETDLITNTEQEEILC